MAQVDPFTLKRLARFADDFRAKQGRLATLRDLEENGFSKECVERAVREKILETLYVTLTTGATAKVYKRVT